MDTQGGSSKQFRGGKSEGTSKKLKLSPRENLCVVLYLADDYGVFMVKLNDDVADGMRCVYPNIRFRESDTLGFCVADRTLYIFPSSYSGVDADARVVYSYPLSDISDNNEVVIESDMLDMAATRVLEASYASVSAVLLLVCFLLKEFFGIVSSLEKAVRDSMQLVKVGSARITAKQLKHRVGVKPTLADCLEGLRLLEEMHQSDASDDLGALQELLVDQPNIPQEKVKLLGVHC